MTQTEMNGKAVGHEDLEGEIIDAIVTEGMVDRSKVDPDASLESLELESFEVVMILTALEEKFDVYIPIDGPLSEAKTVREFISGVAQHVARERA